MKFEVLRAATLLGTSTTRQNECPGCATSPPEQERIGCSIAASGGYPLSIAPPSCRFP